MARFFVFLLLHMAPALYCLINFSNFTYWSLNTIFVVLLVLSTTSFSSYKYYKVTMCIFSFLFSITNLLLCSSLYLQGTGFNEAFFYHADIETVKVGLNQFPLLSLYGSLYIIAVTLIPLSLIRIRPQPLRKFWFPFFLVASLFSSPPLVSAVGYLNDRQEAQNIWLRSHNSDQLKLELLKNKPKNIVLIYAESLEKIYFDKNIFGNLLPKLTELKKSGLDFQNIRQVRGTAFTTAGIIASQCSVPLNIRYQKGEGANSTLSGLERPLPNHICLSDILKAHNYKTVFMGGADQNFGGKANFMKAHSYDEIYGKFELIPLLTDPSYYIGWGVFDDSLFEFAERKLDELYANDQPFLLSLLTLDTHHPNGHPSKSCKPLLEGHNKFLDAIYCSDQLISKFITKLRSRNDFENTLIILMSDHLAQRNGVWDKLQAHMKKRRLSFTLWDKKINAGVMHNAGMHFDIAPTILSATGFNNYQSHNLGSNLLTGNDGYWYQENKKAKSYAKKIDATGEKIQLVSDVEFLIDGPSIKLGDQLIRSNYNGLELRKRIFAMIFDKNSKDFSGFISVKSLQEFKTLASTNFVLAISESEKFNQHYLDDKSQSRLSFYAGYPNGETIAAGPLVKDVSISINSTVY